MGEHLKDEAERIADIKKDTEVTARLLGALGLVDATLFDYDNPEHNDSTWLSVN